MIWFYTNNTWLPVQFNAEDPNVPGARSSMAVTGFTNSTGAEFALLCGGEALGTLYHGNKIRNYIGYSRFATGEAGQLTSFSGCKH
jgi:hypothetical protein